MNKLTFTLLAMAAVVGAFMFANPMSMAEAANSVQEAGAISRVKEHEPSQSTGGLIVPDGLKVKPVEGWKRIF